MNWMVDAVHAHAKHARAVELVLNGYHKVFSFYSGEHRYYAKFYGPTLPSAIDPALEAAFVSDLELRGVEGAVKLVAKGEAVNDEAATCRFNIFTEATGRPLSHTIGDFAAFGRSLGKLHSQAFMSARMLPEVSPAQYCLSAVDLLEMDDSRDDRRLVEGLLEIADIIGMANLENAFIHGDARIANASLSGGEATFFDFEQAARGPSVFDLSTVAWWLSSGQCDGCRAFWKAFLSGYATASSFSTGELSLLPELTITNEARTLPLIRRLVDGDGSAWLWRSTVTRLSSAIVRYQADRKSLFPGD